jgi:nucleotide-binding universal stress UspA family protein
MSSTNVPSPAPTAAPLLPTTPFKHILCAIDGSRSALEAVRQAGALAVEGTTIELVAVAYEVGAGTSGFALLTHDHAEHALHEAAQLLKRTPAEIVTRTANGKPAWKLLLEESEAADLLVVGRHEHSRGAGMTYGSNATNIIHRARTSLLVAVEPPDGRPFPGLILVAADGPGHPEDAVRVAGRIAAQAPDASITLLRLDWSHRAKPPELATAVAEVRELTGSDPVELVFGGTPHRRIPEYAASEGASLVVMGTRGLTGVHALRSVSERVAHEAPCSVLIVHRHADA